MDFKQQLELAAKAAGIKGEYFEDYWEGEQTPFQIGLTTDAFHCWNPRDDDGDALRLAAQLEIDYLYKLHEYELMEEYDIDRLATIRKAIFMAAVQIGSKREDPQQYGPFDY